MKISGSVSRGAFAAAAGRRGALARGFAGTSKVSVIEQKGASTVLHSTPVGAGAKPGPAGASPGAAAAGTVPPVAPVVVKTVPAAKPPAVVANFPPPPPPKKKRTSLTGYLVRLLLLATAVYGGTLYAATKNDRVLDFVIDNDLPYHEELLELIETGSVEDVKRKFEELKETIANLEFKLPFSREELSEITTKIEEKGKELASQASKVTTGAASKAHSKGNGADGLEAGNATPAQQLQKPVETIHKAIEHLPLIELKGAAKSVDASVRATIDSFNELVRTIDVEKTPASSAAIIKTISDNVTVLSNKLNALTASFEDELQSKLKVSQTELLSGYTKKELELTQNFLDQFNHEKAQLEKKLNETLQQEIEATKETISQAAVNAVTLMRIETTKNFETLIQDQIDSERDGRLKNLASVNSRLEKVEEFVTSLESQLKVNHQKTTVQKALSKLKALVFNPNFADEKPQLLTPYVAELQRAVGESDDELLKVAVADLAAVAQAESTHSILNNSQLLSRWEQLAPELRSASLLPPNAGLLGHLSSILFSKLLLPTKGAKPDGKDIESVIGRVEQSLSRGQLDVAIEEAANLKGWSRKLADDWVVEGRKRLEVEFLLNLIDSEARVL